MSDAVFPHTAALLVDGGDSRIALDAQGLNKYGCPPAPDAALLAFGSCTASTISAGAYRAADALRQQSQSSRLAANEFYLQTLEHMREQLRQEFGLPYGVETVFAASGTDLHLIAGQLAAHRQPCQAVLIAAAETGASVPMALRGKQFSSRTAMGATVKVGDAIAGAAANTVSTVALREAEGQPRAIEAIDADVEALVATAATQQKPVLLVLVDVSKTGMVAPSLGCAINIQRRYPETTVLVDACQLRLTPLRIRQYLNHGFMVAITGSKFLGGPTFSAALLLPEPGTRRLRQHPLPQGLADYTSRADWPSHWPGAQGLPMGCNLGLLLRWQAALYELRAFHALPADRVFSIVQAFASAVEDRLHHDPMFVPLPGQLPTELASRWDQLPTIFPFLLHVHDKILPREAVERLYLQLQRPIGDGVGERRCQLGQPVACNAEFSALRLCLSARHVVTAANGGLAQLLESAMLALDKTVWLAQQLGTKSS